MDFNEEDYQSDVDAAESVEDLYAAYISHVRTPVEGCASLDALLKATWFNGLLAAAAIVRREGQDSGITTIIDAATAHQRSGRVM